MNGRMRVLVFDDDQNVLKLTERHLTELGCEVFAFPKAAVFCAHHPWACQCGWPECCADAAICDVRMPAVSGLDLVERQRARHCRIRSWALMSGEWSEKATRAAAILGCDVLEKPVTLRALAEWLGACERNVDPLRVLVDRYDASTASGAESCPADRESV